MKKAVLHLMVSLFLVQFLLAGTMTALELPDPRDHTDEISTFHLLDLNCDFTESPGKSNDFTGDRQTDGSIIQECSGSFSRAAFLVSPAYSRPFLSSYKDISHLRL